VLARSLILWNGVEPTSQWIEEQIPSVVKVAYDKLQEMANRRNDVDRAKVADIAQESNGEGESNQPRNSIQMNSDSLRYCSIATTPFFEANVDIDRQSVRQIHAYILAGSCFSMGLRFAGTANESAARTITKVILDMKWLRDSSEPASLALRPEKAIVGMCLGLCAISLAFVMAGTGDLDTFRLFRSIRWRSDEGIRHGEHIAVSAAIGLLFLGAGQCTLGRTNEDIAALVAAFFPRFPMDANDNKYHLQPLRHLYVLASRQRVVKTIDVESGNSISVHFLKVRKNVELQRKQMYSYY
jgi:anaphase-promoting complex subunit 1